MKKIKNSPKKILFIILSVFLTIVILSIIFIVKNKINKQKNIDSLKIENCFTKDENGVYYNCGVVNGKIDGANPDSLEILNDLYIKDKNNVFCCPGECKKLVSADVKTFGILADGGGFYAKDAKNTYKDGDKINVDYKSFKPLNINYFLDKNGVYFDSLKIKNADLKTFKVTSDLKAEDKNNKYLSGEILKQ